MAPPAENLAAWSKALRNKLPHGKKAADAFGSFPDDFCLTLTLDNGQENYCHAELESLFGFKVYFTAPGCAWQKGRLENAFGLLRRYLPKETKLVGYMANRFPP